MRIDRRRVLKGGALAGAAAAMPATVHAAASAATPTLVVFDSSFAESAHFAGMARLSTSAALDLAAPAGWATLRTQAAPARVEGVTRWSDWVAARGLLEERGLRLVSETRASAPISGATHLFRWTMAAR